MDWIRGGTWSDLHLRRITLLSVLRTESRLSRQPQILTHTRLFSRYAVSCRPSRSLHLQILLPRMLFPLLSRFSSSLFGTQLLDTLLVTPSPTRAGSINSCSHCHYPVPDTRISVSVSFSPWTRCSSSSRTAAGLALRVRAPHTAWLSVGAWKIPSGWQELSEH